MNDSPMQMMSTKWSPMNSHTRTNLFNHVHRTIVNEWVRGLVLGAAHLIWFQDLRCNSPRFENWDGRPLTVLLQPTNKIGACLTTTTKPSCRTTWKAHWPQNLETANLNSSPPKRWFKVDIIQRD